MNVSLLVTSFGRGSLFEKSLPSILDQFTTEDEIVVVNDGVPDAMEYILRGAMVYKGTDGNKVELQPVKHQYIDTGNRHYRGGSIAKNIALKAAKNEIVIISDPEVIHLTPCIKQIKKLLDEHPRYFIVPANMFPARDPKNDITQSDYFRTSMAPFVGGVMKKELMKIGGWDERFVKWGNDDNDLMYRLGMNGVSVHSSENLCAYHQWHDRAPSEAIGDANEALLYEKDKQIVANQGKEWGVVYK